MTMTERKIEHDRVDALIKEIGGREKVKMIGLNYVLIDYCPFCPDLGNFNGKGDCTDCHLYKAGIKSGLNQLF